MTLGLRRDLLLSWLLAAAAVWCMPVSGGEPFQSFLDGLRERQYFDTALEYLEQSKTNPLVSEIDRQRIEFEEGRTLVEQAATVRDLAVRNQRLDEAQARFEAFIQNHPSDPVAKEAALQLGTVLVERGRVALANAKQPRNAARQQELLTEARGRFEQAQKIFADAEQKFDAEFQTFPKVVDPKDRAQVQARDQARLNLIQAQMLSATVQYDITKTLDAASPDYLRLLQAAATKYEEIYKLYPTLLVGLYARMHQAQCLLDLNNATDAVTYLDEVLAQAGSAPRLRRLATKALPIAMQGWGQLQQFDRMIEAGAAWQSDSTGLERQSPEGLTIVWYMAQAHNDRANKSDGRPRDTDRRQAARLAAHVARMPGEHQEPARALLAELRKTIVDAEAKSFADAMAQAKGAIDELTAALHEMKESEGNNVKLSELEQTKTEAIERAKQGLALALSLRTPDVQLDEVNELRYYQTYLNYLEGRWFDAAVLGEFVARNYPETAMARQSARIALAAYLQAYNAESGAEREFEMQRMQSLAELIAERWPGQPEATEAWLLLGDVAIRSGDMRAANLYLARIPESSPQRADADLKQGQAIWARYLEEQRSEQGTTAGDLDELLSQARAMLEKGVERGRQSGQEPSFNVLAAELTLAQIYNAALQYDQALELLNRADTGPLALVAANHPAVARGNYAGEALKVALRSYVGAQKLDQAERIMDDLEKHFANTPTGDAQLTAIYVALGRELESQVKQLQSDSKQDQLKQVLGGFQLFLDRIAARDVASPATLLWIGETYSRLATGIEGDAAQSAQAKEYFAKSKTAYEKLLKLGENDPKLQQSAAAVRLRLARAYRGTGEFAAALAQLTAVLQANPNVLECQIEAAETYAQWGRVDAQHLLTAINGAEKQQVWGWNGIRRRLQNAPKFQAQYEESRFQVADCSFRLAMSKQGAERTNSLNAVERLIQSFARLDPELGGGQWREKYDRLLKDVQRAAGRQPEGLSTIPPATTARSRSSSAS